MIHVAVAVIRNTNGEVLLSKRPDHVHQGGLWEFPGGKVEAGESVTTALQRELEEELGILARTFQPLISIPHQYTDKTVLLDVWEVTALSGLPHGKEGQPLAWVDTGLLAKHAWQTTNFPLPEANFGIVKAISLGSKMAISGNFTDEKDFIRRLNVAIVRGAEVFQCRLPMLSPEKSSILLEHAGALCRKANVKILINNHFNEAKSEQADGHHLTAAQLMALRERPKEMARILGASCHDETELKQAMRLDLDYVTLSPIHNTPSHPEAECLGWERFENLVREANLPVYGLGGLALDDLGEARARGAQGIAAISAFWDD